MFLLCTIVVSARKIKQIIINVEDECSDSARAEIGLEKQQIWCISSKR